MALQDRFATASTAARGLDRGQRTHGWWLALIVLVAMAFRVLLAGFPGTEHPDEIYQATEQAHRLLFGYGIVPWEFRAGARSWLIPGFLAGLLAPLSWVWPEPRDYLAGLSIALGALSLVSVWAAWDIGRPFGRAYAVAAAFAVAAWIELAWFGIRPLSESFATSSLLAAIALLTGDGTRRRLFWGGLALGVAFILRFHLAPALAIVALASGGSDFRKRWLPMLAGAAIPVAILGAVDAATWGTPFGSLVSNLRFNLVDGRASVFGTAPAWAYLFSVADRWGLALIVLAPLIGIGATRKPLLLWVALAIIVSHSLIPHKEHRFIVPALACLIVLAGIGMAELAGAIRHRFAGAAAQRLPLPGLLILFAATSLAVAPSATAHRLGADRNLREAFSSLHRDPTLCGLALADQRWFLSPGYAALHRPMPIYLWDRLVANGNSNAASAIVVAGDEPSPDASFGATECFGEEGDAFAPVCIHRRGGDCQAAPGLDLNAELTRIGQ